MPHPTGPEDTTPESADPAAPADAPGRFGSSKQVEPSGDADELASGVPYRAIAMVLLTLVIIAVGVGIAQLLGGGDDNESTSAAASSSQSSTPGHDTAGGQSPDGGAAGAAGAPAPGAGATSGTGASTGAEGQPGQGTSAAPAEQGTAPGDNANGAATAPGNVNVIVYNNSLVHGLADKVAGQLRGSGARVTEVGNFAEANIPQSGVYYGTGPGEQAEAERIAQQLGVSAQPRTPGLERAPGGVVVIVTQDLNR